MSENRKYYFVINEGEPVFASKDQDEAEGYSYNAFNDAVNEALEEMGCDDPEENDNVLASIKAGMDGGSYEIEMIDMSKYDEGDEIELKDGTTVDYDDLVRTIEQSEQDDWDSD